MKLLLDAHAFIWWKDHAHNDSSTALKLAFLSRTVIVNKDIHGFSP
jgi:PIN domain nuclease of toxin-antitoxin system